MKKVKMLGVSKNLASPNLFTAIALTLFLTLPFVGSAQTSSSFISDGKVISINTFDQEIDEMLATTSVPGMSLAIIENDEIVYKNAYGHKNVSRKNNVDVNTVFEAASLTKIYLLYIVYKLVEDGRLDLEKPMYQYLEHEQLAHDERYKLITPRMIINHTSGLENWSWFNDGEVLELINNPGEKYTYSGEGYQYLAKVVGLILGSDYDSYVKEMVLDPMGLDRTFLKYTFKKWIPFHGGLPRNYATGYTSLDKKVGKWKNKNSYPASGAHTTAGDYAKFIVGVFSEDGLAASSVEEILAPHLVFDKKKGSVFGISDGLYVINHKGESIVNFGGSNEGFRAQIMYSVTNKRGFVYFTNSDRGLILTEKLNELTANLDLEVYNEYFNFEQYPSVSNTLFELYKKRGLEALTQQLELNEVSCRSLNDLSEMFMSFDLKTALMLAEKSKAQDPNSSMAYSLVGVAHLEMQNYPLAYENLSKAKEMGFSLWDLDNFIEVSKNMSSSAQSSTN